MSCQDVSAADILYPSRPPRTRCADLQGQYTRSSPTANIFNRAQDTDLLRSQHTRSMPIQLPLSGPSPRSTQIQPLHHTLSISRRTTVTRPSHYPTRDRTQHRHRIRQRATSPTSRPTPRDCIVMLLTNSNSNTKTQLVGLPASTSL